MTPDAASSSARPRQSSWRLALPFASVVVGAFALCATLGFVLVRQSEVLSQQQCRAALLGVIGEFRTGFAAVAARRAHDLVAMVGGASAPSAARLDDEIAPSDADHYRHDAAYVVGREGRILASFPPGVTALPSSLARLLQADHPGVGAAGSSAGVARTDFVLLGGQPAIAAVAALRGGPQTRQEAPGVLVTVARLGPRLVAALEKASGAESLSVDAEPVRGSHEVQSLIDGDGRIIGWLGWRARDPTAATVVQLAPLLGLLALGLVAFTALAFRQVSRSTNDLAARRAEAVKIANEDPLTGLPNRRRILDELDRLLAGRQDGKHVCFAFLDLDAFKDVNEALGHRVGDQLLIYVAERLHGATAGLGTVGRIGGDEFAMVMEVASPTAAVQLTNLAINAMAQPFWLAGQALQVGMSVGLAQAPLHGETRDELTRRADLALRAAKRQTRGRMTMFEPAMEDELNDQRFVNRELRHTLAEGGLDVHYQPIVAADGQRIVGVEALLRWRHPVRGDIPPTVFVPVAEQTGLMPKLGEFVLRRALSDAHRWKDVYIAVNLSPVQVRDRNLVELVNSVLKETGVEPERVVMEITEGVLIENPAEAQARLERLRALGVKIALDDFGSGYSSLSYLRRFPIDKLKIDKEFVSPLGYSANGGVIIQAIMTLGRALGLTVLCEGVETEEQRVLLRLAGCDEMQGFLFARPGPAHGIDRLLSEGGAGRDPARLRRAGRSEA